MYVTNSLATDNKNFEMYASITLSVVTYKENNYNSLISTGEN